MPVIHLADNPHSPRSMPTTHSFDAELIWTLFILSGILLLQAVLGISCIHYHNLRSKARWRILRERGIVIVNNSTLVWADSLPLQSQISYINLKNAITPKASKQKVATDETV
ncbi:hypothetical protein GQ44DRAFT_15365 [Phaeosphaeriaceae sp. PMI808]|nr:hypothetical protein GQ44DRAFT_15365 [Phaeosphaeriaceae sp. PMI808]